MAITNENKAYRLLRHPNFLYYSLARFLYNFAFQALHTLLAWQLYKSTGNNFYIGLMGLCLALPYILCALFAGYIADHYNQKKIILISLGFFFILSIAITILVFYQLKPLFIFFLLLIFFSITKAFLAAAQKVIFAQIINKSAYTQGATIDATFWQISFLLGPLFASGLLYFSAAFWVSLSIPFFFLLAFIFFLLIRKPQIPLPQKEPILQSLQVGIQFIRNTPVLLGAISLDMFAVLFGGAMALLPAFVSTILHANELVFGLLRIAIFLGSTCMGIYLTYHPPYAKAGKNLFIAVFGFGICMFIFAFIRNAYLAFLVLFLAGIFDCISVVIRSALFQIYTPDDMRGRVSAINSIFITSSNELGEAESGFTAKYMGLIPALIFGGSMTLLSTSIIYTAFKDLKKLKLNH